MAFMWTVLLLALWDISHGYKLPAGEFKDRDAYNKVLLTVEDHFTVNSTTANLVQRLSRDVTSELDRKFFKGPRVRREVTEEDYSLLDDMTTAAEQNQTMKTFTIETNNTTIEPKHQTDILSTQAELNNEASHTFVTHSTMQDITSTTGLYISEIVTNIASTQNLAASQTTNATLQMETENRTANYSTGSIDPGIKSTATPLATLSRTSQSLIGPGLVDKPDPDPTTSKFGVTNEENSPPETQNIMHSLMAQCLLVISILAFIAMVFIICTIVLATKLSKLRNRYKLLTKNSTEMVYLSSLLPENDQPVGKTKAKATKLKTFGATADDGEGDNLTLNSLLPDH